MARLRDTRLRRASGGATAAATVATATAPPGINHSRPSLSPPTWDEALKQLPASGTLKVGNETGLSPTRARKTAIQNFKSTYSGWKFWHYKNTAGEWCPIDELR